jgi:hypothetical protein
VRLLSSILFSALLAACSGDGGGADAGTRLPLDERLEPGQVRAGVIAKESELLEGPEAHGWIGDFKLYNHRAGFVIQGIDSPRAWGSYGGTLIDADRVREEGEAGHEALEEIMVQIDLMTMYPESAEVINDGGDGRPAVVRVAGSHRSIPPLDAAIPGSMQPQDLDIVDEYILAPDSDHLQIRTSVDGRASSLSVGDMVRLGDTTGKFEGEVLGGYNPDLCYLYAGVDGNIQLAFGLYEVAFWKVHEGAVPLTSERLLLVGAGGLDDCLRKYRAIQGESDLGLLAGTAPAGASVLALSGTKLANQTHADENGSFEMQLPPGTYVLSAKNALSDPIEVVANQTVSASVSASASGFLKYECNVPCKVSLQPGPAAPLASPVDLDTLTFDIDGSGEIEVPPGDWTVTLSRGWEYSIHRQDVTLEAGQTAQVTAQLERQVDTTGFIAADLHTHCTRSLDSDYDIGDKLASNICEGIEFLVSTDHDAQTNYQPVLKRMQAEDLIRVVVGNEISALYGHSVVYPLPVHPLGWNYWSFPWTLYEDDLFVRQLEYPEIWPKARELGAEIVTVAHPLSYTAWFSYLGFDPPAVIPRIEDLPPDKFSADFDAIELLNQRDPDARLEVMLEKVLPVWSSMNNQGYFKTAVGVSDSHERDTEAGLGRTLIASSSEDPKNIDLDEIFASLKNGRALVGGGIFANIHIADAAIGDLTTQTAPFEVRIVVQAADWVPVEQVILLENGATIATLPLEPYTTNAVRLDTTVTVNPTQDSWYAAVATGRIDDRLDPVFRGARPVGMTNAIRVDVDGNGVFDPPTP